MLYQTEKSDCHFLLLGNDKEIEIALLLYLLGYELCNRETVGSVLGRGKRLPSSLICPHSLCGTTSLLCNGHIATSPETEGSRRDFDRLFPSSSEVRMCGAQLLVPHTHSYNSEEQLYEVTANHTVT